MLRINDIFFDILDGSTFAGFPGVFITLAGGKPGAHYVTHNPARAVITSRSLPVEEIIDEISKYNCYIAVLAGGDPLIQENIHALISALINRNYLVLVETPGTLSIKNLNSKAIIIIALPLKEGSGFENFKMENLGLLRPKDQLKFIISSSRDYHLAKELIFKEMLFEKCNLLFYADEESLPTKTLADWIIADQLPVRLGIKLSRSLQS